MKRASATPQGAEGAGEQVHKYSLLIPLLHLNIPYKHNNSKHRTEFIQSVSAWVLLKITIPVGLRVQNAIQKPSRDFKLRRYIEEKLGRLATNNAGISEVRIERKADQID